MASCNRCEAKYGFKCQDEKFLGLFFSQCLILQGDTSVLRTSEPVDQCPVILGTLTQEQIAAQILKNIKTASETIDLSLWKHSNW